MGALGAVPYLELWFSWILMSRGESHTLKNSLLTVVTCYYLQIEMSKFCRLSTDYEQNIMKDL